METLIGILTWEFIVGLISTMIHNNNVRDIAGVISILSTLVMIITGLIGSFII